MPRGPRLDAAGTLHHVMLRGVAGGQIVADRQDRADFLARLGLSLAEAGRQLGISTSGIAKAVERAERREVH